MFNTYLFSINQESVTHWRYTDEQKHGPFPNVGETGTSITDTEWRGLKRSRRNARENPSILPLRKRESEGNFLEVQTLDQGIKNEKMKVSRAS